MGHGELINDPVMAAARVRDLSPAELDRLDTAWSQIEQTREQLDADLAEFERLRGETGEC